MEFYLQKCKMKTSTDTSHEYKLQENISRALISNELLYALQS